MHSVDRGPEPIGLGQIRVSFTPRWVQYYRSGIGTKPNDSRWRNFHDDLRNVFWGLCGYCEDITSGEVDHFQPKHLYPDLVYSWTNWIYACHDCNQAKHWKWPSGGYVDPCAKSDIEQPERYFKFDTLTGEILPNDGLSSLDHTRARETIYDLKLNARHHLQKRTVWLRLISGIIPDYPDGRVPELDGELGYFASRTTKYSSITRALLSELGYQISK